MRACAWCGIRFLAWDHSQQAFCKPLHSKKANEKRRKANLARTRLRLDNHT